MKICDLININELSVNFDLQVKYFLHVLHCWEIPDTMGGHKDKWTRRYTVLRIFQIKVV